MRRAVWGRGDLPGNAGQQCHHIQKRWSFALCVLLRFHHSTQQVTNLGMSSPDRTIQIVFTQHSFPCRRMVAHCGRNRARFWASSMCCLAFWQTGCAQASLRAAIAGTGSVAAHHSAILKPGWSASTREAAAFHSPARRARFTIVRGARSGDHRPRFTRNRGNVG